MPDCPPFTARQVLSRGEKYTMTTREELQAAVVRMDAAKKALLDCFDTAETVFTHQRLLQEIKESMGEFIRLLREPMDDRDE
jgi:hypothetical protein